MKRFILLSLVALFYSSCNISNSTEKSTEKSQTELDYEIADMFLEFDAEKIGLISIIKDIPQEKANAVLRDYLAKTFRSTIQTMEDPNYVVKVIDTIAKKNDLPKKLTASIIFSYQYEMITRDEIIEGYQGEMINYQNEVDQY